MNSRSSSLAIITLLAVGCSDDAPPPPLDGTSGSTANDTFVSGMTDGTTDSGDGGSSTGEPSMTTASGSSSGGEPSDSSSSDGEGTSSGGASSTSDPTTSVGTMSETDDGSSSEGSDSGEASESSSSSSGDPSATSGETGTVDTCGDMIVDAGEDCDDGNDLDLDACHDDCSFHRVTELALGGNHSCARFDSGMAMCWGNGAGGRTGHASVINIGDDEPASAGGIVDLGGEAAHIVAGASHTCVLHSNGSVRCFGAASLGQLGRGNLTVVGDDETPGSKSALQLGGTAMAIGTRSGAFHTCATISTDEVKCWGQYTSSQLGIPGQAEPIGDDETVENAPAVDVGGVPIAYATGAQHTCALLEGGEGAVRCWGTGSNGALGYANSHTIGDDEDPASAGDVLVGGKVVALTAGWYHTCAILDGGAVRCWGRGNDGRLGYGNSAYVGVTQAPEDVGLVSLDGPAIEIASGLAHTCVLLDSGEVQCWGVGASGQLGYAGTASIGDNELPSSMGTVDVGAPVEHIAADGNHTCAVTDTGSVRCWGHGGEGRLGYGNVNHIGDDETPASVGDVPLF